MDYYPCTKVQLSLLVLFVINIVMLTNASFWNPAITETFTSAISQSTPLLDVHCQSKDNDLGIRTLKSGDKFDFSFHRTLLDTTHFYCKFTWGANTTTFDVYYKHKSPCKYTGVIATDLCCTWMIEDNAIYLARTNNPSPHDFEYVRTWD
ncbi:hypothetical protein H5410_039737 [Solanum commersonii]|uniref:S-protein homolog n=1 Tax=Solanum commersonii TaxID=4109 RepID=A0A9J5XP02_SOLCO|nr:hypothetical protein H5410_039737 [Solanum commersonii]